MSAIPKEGNGCEDDGGKQQFFHDESSNARAVRGSPQRRNQRIVSKRSVRVRANHWRYDSVTPDDRGAHVPGSTYFSTANTDRCRTFLNDADVWSSLREASRTLRLTHPFLIEALLPAPANESARTRAYAR